MKLPARTEIRDGKPVIVVELPSDCEPRLLDAVIVQRRQHGSVTFKQVT